MRSKQASTIPVFRWHLKYPIYSESRLRRFSKTSKMDHNSTHPEDRISFRKKSKHKKKAAFRKRLPLIFWQQVVIVAYYQLKDNGGNTTVYFRSNRSKDITLLHAFMKSRRNFSSESALPYTSAIALNSEFEPKIRSERVAVHFTSFVSRSSPSKSLRSSDTGFHSLLRSSRFRKKSFVRVPGLSVKTPCLDPSQLVSSTRIPPSSTVISGAVSDISCDRSTSISSSVASLIVLK